jgi:outer membrane protein OmpA-like peptidoglycan-associated protein
MDLVISLLAFVVLVLAILALERKASTEMVSLKAITEVKDPIQEPAATKETSIPGLKAEIAALLARQEALETQIAQDATDAQSKEATIHASRLLRYVAERDLLELRASQEEEIQAAVLSFSKANEEQSESYAALQENNKTLKTDQETLEAQHEATLSRLAISESRAGQLQDQIATLSGTIASLRAQNASLSGEVVALADETDKPRKEIDRLQQQLDATNREHEDILAAKNQELSDMATQIAALQQQIEGPEGQAQLQENRVPIKLNDSGDLKIFEPGKAVLTAAGRQKLYSLIPSMLTTINRSPTNVVRIAGHASPEPMEIVEGSRLDRNLLLSAERALVIAYELAALGVPIRCIAIESYGRGRSPTLSNFPGDMALSVYDAQVYSGIPKAQRTEIISLWAKERRVEIMATLEENGQCSPAFLQRGMERAFVEANKALGRRR